MFKGFQKNDHFIIELTENQFFSVPLALAGKHVQLLRYSYVPNAKNPDATINGRIVDYKFPSHAKNPVAAIQNGIRNANTQGAAIVVIYLANPILEVRDIKRALIAGLQTNWNRNIEEVWLIYPNWSLIEIKRSEIEDFSFVSKLKEVW